MFLRILFKYNTQKGALHKMAYYRPTLPWRASTNLDMVLCQNVSFVCNNRPKLTPGQN